MSAGHVHTKACLMLAGGFLVGTVFSRQPEDIQYVAGALAGIFVSPDCDVDSKFIAYKYIRQRLGKLAETAWNFLWYYYRKSIKHGSELSHVPIVGTTGRLLYLYCFGIVLPYVILCQVLPLDFWYELDWWSKHILVYWKIWIGLMGADLIHWALDIATTEHKHGHRMGVPSVRRNIRKTQVHKTTGLLLLRRILGTTRKG